MFTFLGRFTFRRRWVVLVGTVVFMTAALVTGLSVFDKLGSGGFEDPNAESTQATEILADRFEAGSPNLVLLVTAPDGDVDGSSAVQAGTELTDALIDEPGVEQVTSYWGALEDGGGSPELRSTDGDTGLVLVRLSGTENEADVVSTRLQEAYEGSAGDLEVQIGGPGVGLGETIGEDLARAEAIAIPITLLLLLLVFGGVIAALLPLAVGMLAIMGTFLALFLIASATDVSIFSINLATALGLGLAIDYSLLVVSRFREEFAKDSDTQAAVARTMQTAGRTVAFSAITVAVSLSALLIFPLYFLRSFAYAGISVVAIAALAALFTLPALLSVLGPRVNKFAVRRKPKASNEAGASSGFWYSLSHTVMRRPILTGLPVVVLLAALALPFLGVSFSLPDDRALPTYSTARIVGDSLRNDFDDTGATSFPVVLPEATDEQTTAMAELISDIPEVNQVETSTGTFAGGARTTEPGPPSARFSDGSGSYLTVFSSAEPVSPEGEALVNQIRALDADVPFLVSGAAAQLVDSKTAIFGLVPLALGIIALATFILLFLMTGSVLVPIKAIVLNVLSLGATFGAMVWVFQNGNGAELLNFTSTGTLDTSIPVLMFCIAFGLSMDYEVFLLSRIKEEHDRTGDTRAAVAVGLQKTGKIMTAAAGVLAVTFIAFSTSQVTFIKMMGLGLTIAILMDATLVRGVLVPAFMRLAGEANWWAPPFMRKLHNRFGLSESESPAPQPVPERMSV